MPNANSRQLAVRIEMLPSDTDIDGNVDGGVILCHIDLAAAYVARQACQNARITRMVTRAMDEVEFKRSVKAHDVISCYGKILRTGTTSVTVFVEVEADRAGEIIPVTCATAVFVAVDDNDKPIPLCGSSEAKITEAPAKSETPAKAAAQKPKEPLPQAQPKPIGRRTIALRKAMMPAETNGMGNIFGGLLMTYMNQAGAYIARRICKNNFIQRCATRAMKKVEFKKPVHVNDIITCYGTLMLIGNTSITVHVEVEADRAGEIIPVTQADFVFVAVNKRGRAVSVVQCKGTKSPKKRACPRAGKSARNATGKRTKSNDSTKTTSKNRKAKASEKSGQCGCSRTGKQNRS